VSVCAIGLLIPESDGLKWLALSPVYIMPPFFYIPSLITYVCYHTNAAEALVSLVVLIIACRNIEPLWGPLELTRFVAVISVGAGLCTSVIIYITAALSPNWKEFLLYNVQFYGFTPLLAAFGVVGKQLWTEMPLIGSWTGIRLKTVPALLVGTHVTLAMLGFRFSLLRVLPSLFGAVIAWCYLRFLQVTSGGMRGDSSDSFSLSSFFPELLRPHVARLLRESLSPTLPIYHTRSSSGDVTPAIPTAVLDGSATLTPADVERRRALAQSALDERLKQSTG